jgi:hypothetical protein
MKHRIGHRVIALAVVLSASAILAAPGLAARPDDKPGLLGVGAVSASIETPAAVTYFYANERATLLDSGRALRPDDRPGPRGAGAVGGQSVTSSATSADDGFEWTAAGLGAGFIVALGLLGGLLVASVRRFERHPA